MTTNGKVKVATMWLSGCSGCHMSFLDLAERLVELKYECKLEGAAK
jgi:NAD-reducing hydrogenase small subunit